MKVSSLRFFGILHFAYADHYDLPKKIARRKPGDKPYGAMLYVQFLAGGIKRIFDFFL
jgi:hypothetical protein